MLQDPIHKALRTIHVLIGSGLKCIPNGCNKVHWVFLTHFSFGLEYHTVPGKISEVMNKLSCLHNQVLKIT